MVKLENFAGLTRKQEDLLKKSYSYGSLALLNANFQQGDFTFHTRAAHGKNGSTDPVVSAWIQIKDGLASWKAKKRTDGLHHYVLEWTPKSIVDNVKVKAECKTENHRTEPNVSVEYTHAHAKAKLAFLGNPFVVKGSVTTGKGDYGLGLDGKYNTQTQQLQAYNIAAWFFRKHSKLVVKHAGSGAESFENGNLEVSYYHKLSPKVHVASRVVNNLKANTTGFEIGGDYKYDDSTVLKAKIGSTGVVGLALIRQLNQNVKLTLASGVDSKAISANDLHDFKFGLRLDYNQ